MKGLILSGGHGARLRPITYSQQKQLIPIANKPILFYCIEDLINAGIHDIAIVVGPNKEQVIDTVRSAQWDAAIEFVHQDAPRGLAHAVKIAEKFLEDEKFIMYLGDNLLKGGITGFVNDFIDADVESSLLLTRVENPHQYGVALVDEQKKVIVKLMEKPRNPPSNLSIVGIYGLTPSIFEAIERIKPSWRGELEITDALHWLIEKGYSIRYDLVEGWWKDTGKPEDLLEANRLILDGICSENKGCIENSRINGRIVIGDNTVIEEHSTIAGPAIIGDNCTISSAYVGPFTSIGNNCRIIDTEVENSIVLDGSDIVHGGKIIESLIGKEVRIRKNNSLPKGKKLVVGDNSEIEL
ncbi:MAG: glucose-1-phosphate thymidylyltransferase [Methanomicrobiaceae archaeon]|nr:glucose-1-phosphate thymidylyltransferase [Methanomicrobiaceae archaeon]